MKIEADLAAVNKPGDKEQLEYLRILVMVWQKIDIIWGMFVTSYIPLFGFLHFYQGAMGGSFAVLFILAIAIFTWVNATALRTHYDIVGAMSTEYLRLNDTFPDLNAAITRHGMQGKGRLVIFTHGFAFLGFLYMMGERMGGCTAGSGRECLWLGLFR